MMTSWIIGVATAISAAPLVMPMKPTHLVSSPVQAPEADVAAFAGDKRGHLQIAPGRSAFEEQHFIHWCRLPATVIHMVSIR